MQDLAQEAVVLIDNRAFDKGLGLNDKPHATYTQLTGKQARARTRHTGERCERQPVTPWNTAAQSPSAAGI